MKISSKIILIILVVIALIAILVACGKDVNREGLIVEKVYSSSHLGVQYTKINGYNIPITVVRPAKYYLVVNKEKEDRVYIEVSEEIYERYEVGNYYNYEGEIVDS